MKQTPAYTEFHPKWYRTRVSTYWWLWKWPYLKFVIREISSVFVASFVLVTLLQIRALSHGPEAYAGFQDWMRRPLLISMNVISFFFVLVHAITWFNLTPKAMAVRIRGKRVPPLLVAAPNYLVWLAASAVVAWFLVGR